MRFPEQGIQKFRGTLPHPCPLRSSPSYDPTGPLREGTATGCPFFRTIRFMALMRVRCWRLKLPMKSLSGGTGECKKLTQISAVHADCNCLATLAFGRMRVPSAPGFRLHVREACASGRIGNTDEVLAGRALDLASGKLRFALQRLVAMGTVKLKFISAHKFLHPQNAPKGQEKYIKIYSYF